MTTVTAVLRVFAVLVIVFFAPACSDDSADRTAAGDPTTTVVDAPSGSGRHLDTGVLDAPPRATGDVITAEQAEGVSGSVLAAWFAADRARAAAFVTAPEVLDDLFGRTAPSDEVAGDEGAYCSKDDATGSFTGCSYAVVDDSKDGILAVATELAVADGLVLVRSVGFADWND